MSDGVREKRLTVRLFSHRSLYVIAAFPQLSYHETKHVSKQLVSYHDRKRPAESAVVFLMQLLANGPLKAFRKKVHLILSNIEK